MNAFDRMVQHKRKKMLALVVLLVVFPFINVSAGINLTYYLVKDDDKLRPSCVAEEFERYAAVGWVYPLPTNDDEVPTIDTNFYPKLENDYNCKFSKNDICVKKWSIRDWKLNENSLRKRDFIADIRWEDIPTIIVSNRTKEFNERIDIDGDQKVAFSARASGLVEIFLCTGWDPYNYPCYYFHVKGGQVLFGKFPSIPSEISINESNSLTSFRAFSNVLSPNEWRNFLIGFNDSKIEFVDIGLNSKRIEFVDAQPIKPRYFFMRSVNTSLWKIIENDFLYTEVAQVFRFGPQISFNSNDLCISLLVSTCANCQMDFFYQHGSNQYNLKHVEPTEEWIEIKLKDQNVDSDKILIFVKTSFKDDSLNDTKGFWAVDNIRECHENEVKISTIRLRQTLNDQDITEENLSCQIINKPHWRPNKMEYKMITDFPDVSVDYHPDSIKLNWLQEDPKSQIAYLVEYQGIDPCTGDKQDLKRRKSRGFLSTKHNGVTLENLIPYTTYQLNISTLIHKNIKKLRLNTAESDAPTFEEVPYNANISTTNTTANISWAKPACDAVRGRLIHDIVISSDKIKYLKRLEHQTESDYHIKNLRPFTNYTVKVFTARKAHNLYTNTDTISTQFVFTTKPGVSPPVKNLEAYMVDKSSASLSFDLPEIAKGIPIDIQLRSCNALLSKKCKTIFFPIESCKLWPHKYCIDKKVLIPEQMYKFLVSIKNIGTHTFGEEASVDVFTTERVPAAPTNISSKIVDCENGTEYCHLNISWLHPYNQNGSIKLFNIILSKLSDSGIQEDIKEVYKIDNDSYMPQYTHQIRYIPYSARYNVSIQSANEKYQSEFITKEIKTANLGDVVDQSPKLLVNNNDKLIFKPPYLDHRLTFYNMVVIVQDFDRNKSVPEEFTKGNLGDNVCHPFGESWIAQTLKVINNDTVNITIENNDGHRIKPNTQYCITFIITNSYKNTTHDVVYYEKLKTPDTSSAASEEKSVYYNHLYMLLVILLLVPLGFLVYRYVRKRRLIKRPQEPKENVYETLPFEECENNCVSNVNYDHLVHK